MGMRMISIVTPCFNEEGNIDELCERMRKVMAGTGYRYEHIFIDNASTDNTVGKLRAVANNDKRVKIIVNTRNFGHIRSPYYAILQCNGDAVVTLASDLQDPPERIPEFIEKWERAIRLLLV
jgi:polyisoprenyl-phosphate glycosyltransferase